MACIFDSRSCTGCDAGEYGLAIGCYQPRVGKWIARASTERRTFNLDMIESGWAAFFPVYPSLMKDVDFNLAIGAAEAAWQAKRGQWNGNGAKFLLAYEFRAAVKLARATTAAKGITAAFERHCVDLRTKKLVGPLGYHNVPPPYRMWVWPGDVPEATAKLGLT